MNKEILVTGSSGFIGGHLVNKLKELGHYVVGIDIAKPKYFISDEFYLTDISVRDRTLSRIFSNHKFDEVYNLACLMGGMGFIGDRKHDYDIMVRSSLIVANIIQLIVDSGTFPKMFYSSSACCYNMYWQENIDRVSLSEDMAYPAMPDLVYGWQKLFSEQMYQAAKAKGLEVRIARFHNVFGTHTIYDSGKEKAPAAIARKVAFAKVGDEIDIWGDGKATRSFLYIDECIEGILRLMESDYSEPINIGSDELVSVDDLAKMIIKISGKNVFIKHDLSKPQGVRGRNSNNTLIKNQLNWSPSKPLDEGLEKMYWWIYNDIRKVEKIS